MPTPQVRPVVEDSKGAARCGSAAEYKVVGVVMDEDERGSRSSSAPQVGGCGLVHQGASGGCCRVPAKVPA